MPPGCCKTGLGQLRFDQLQLQLQLRMPRFCQLQLQLHIPKFCQLQLQLRVIICLSITITITITRAYMFVNYKCPYVCQLQL